jgi:hypothetical protein
VTIVTLVLAMLVVAAGSLNALMSITGAVESLLGDAMAGIESTVSMRVAIRETRVDLLQVGQGADHFITAEEVAKLRKTLPELVRRYRDAAFTAEDVQNARAIGEAGRIYCERLDQLVNVRDPDGIATAAADTAVRLLIDQIETGYEYNRERLHEKAAGVREAAHSAIRLSQWLWWIFATVIGFLFAIYCVNRWLVLPDEP